MNYEKNYFNEIDLVGLSDSKENSIYVAKCDKPAEHYKFYEFFYGRK